MHAIIEMGSINQSQRVRLSMRNTYFLKEGRELCQKLQYKQVKLIMLRQTKKVLVLYITKAKQIQFQVLIVKSTSVLHTAQRC